MLNGGERLPVATPMPVKFATAATCVTHIVRSATNQGAYFVPYSPVLDDKLQYFLCPLTAFHGEVAVNWLRAAVVWPDPTNLDHIKNVWLLCH